MNGLAVAAIAWLPLSVLAALGIGRWLRRARQAAEDQALALTKPPAPRDETRPGPGPDPVPGHLLPEVPHQQGAASPGQRVPAPAGHYRGNHMVIDTWACGCIYTWTRATGWQRDYDCFDDRLRELLS